MYREKRGRKNDETFTMSVITYAQEWELLMTYTDTQHLQYMTAVDTQKKTLLVFLFALCCWNVTKYFTHLRMYTE